MMDITGFDFRHASNSCIGVATDIINHFELHRRPHEPVDIIPLVTAFDLRFLEMPATTWGFTLESENKIIIAINDQLTTAQTRYVALHEIGHVACWHPDQLNNCIDGQWLYDRFESEATTVAAYLLIPPQAVAEVELPDFKKVARRYLVPQRLARLRWALWELTGQ